MLFLKPLEIRTFAVKKHSKDQSEKFRKQLFKN